MPNIGSPLIAGAYQAFTDNDGRGGLHTNCVTTAARNAIASYLLSVGMEVYVAATDTTYRLKSGYSTPPIDGDWDVAVGPGGNSGGLLRSVATTAARNAITATELVAGMQVYCADTKLTYLLKTGFHTPVVDADWDQYNLTATTVPLTFYVSTTGNDVNDGLTAGTPIRTMRHLIFDLLPDFANYSPITVNIAAGTYAEYMPIFKGALDKANGIIVELIFQGNITTLLGSQTPTSGTYTTTTVSGATWTANAYQGKVVQWLSGPMYNALVALGSEPYHAIATNTADTISFQRTANVIPGPTDRFQIVDKDTIFDGSGWYYLLRYTTPRGLRVNCRDIIFQNVASNGSLVQANNTLSKFVKCTFLGGAFGVSTNDCGNSWYIGCTFLGQTQASIFNAISSGPIVMGCYINNTGVGGMGFRNDSSGTIGIWGATVQGGARGAYASGGAINVARGLEINNTTSAAIDMTGYSTQFVCASSSASLSGTGNTIVNRMTAGGRITTHSGGGITGTVINKILSNGSVYDQNTLIMWTEQGGYIAGQSTLTSDATPTVLCQIPLDDNCTYYVKGEVSFEHGDLSNRGSISVAGTVYRASTGPATQQGSTTVIHNQASVAYDVTITVSGNYAQLQVTGFAATSIYWNGNFSLLKAPT